MTNDFIKAAMFVHMHERATALAAEFEAQGWCCALHEDAVNTSLAWTMQEFRELRPTDATGLAQCMGDVADLVENLEMLAVLNHPGINVWEVGEA